MNSSPKELKRGDQARMNKSQLKTLSQLMQKKKRASRKRPNKESERIRLKLAQARQEDSVSLYTSCNDVDIKNLLRESQLKRDSKAQRFLNGSSQSIKRGFNRGDLHLESIMKSSTYLRKDNSLSSSGIRGTPSKPKSKFAQQSKSPEKLLKRESKLPKSGSKLAGRKLGRGRKSRKQLSELQKNIDLYQQAKKTRSPETVSVMDAVNIYGKAFLTMNHHRSSKHDSRNSHGSGSNSRDGEFKRMSQASQLKAMQAKARKQEPARARGSHRVRSPRRGQLGQKPEHVIKSKAKSRSNEPKKQKRNLQEMASSKRRKVNLFMKSRSRSMSSTSDVSPNRSRSLNKTNSELKKSGSFVEVDQHMGKVIYGYQIQEPLGEGSYARVYRALHVNTKTPVAIKGSSNWSVQQVASVDRPGDLDQAGNQGAHRNQAPEHRHLRGLLLVIDPHLHRHGAHRGAQFVRLLQAALGAIFAFEAVPPVVGEYPGSFAQRLLRASKKGAAAGDRTGELTRSCTR